MKKHAVLICIILSVIFFVIASCLYPGGTITDHTTTGFNWSKNFISNLFGSMALNGMDNPSRIWAIIGMAFDSIGSGIFFFNMSNKIPSKHTSTVLKIVAVGHIIFNFLIATSLHDLMVTVSSTLSLLGLFYITVHILKTKRHILKLLCIMCLLTFYFTLYLYGAGDWGLLAVMQKISFVGLMLMILILEYSTSIKDFTSTKNEVPNLEG